MRTVVAGVVAVALASPAGGELPRRDPGGDAIAYARLVELYERGDDGQAIREIVTWAPGTVVEVIYGVEKGRLVPAVAMVRHAFPAAVMLHTEAGLYLSWRGDSGAAAMQWRHARRLAALEPATPEQAVFLRAWHHAFGLFLLGSYAVGDAVALLDRGLRLFPDDAAMALALGQAYEVRGTFAPGVILSVRARLSRDAVDDLRVAEGLYRGLLARDAVPAEAKLRLGRILDLRGRSDAASRCSGRSPQAASPARGTSHTCLPVSSSGGACAWRRRASRSQRPPPPGRGGRPRRWGWPRPCTGWASAPTPRRR